MRREFQELLACPICLGSLFVEVESEEDEHVLEGRLVCSDCSCAYPISGGVPRLLAKASTSPVKGRIARRFGYEWRHFSDFELEEERTSMATWFRPHRLDDLRGLTVVDAGCGMGRHMVISLRQGARRVVGVDLGDAVEAAFGNTRDLERACVVQGDVCRLPLRHSAFDAGYSLGVLHHLPEPREGLESLARHIKPGGWLQLWLYGREGNEWIVRLVNPIRRLTSRLPLPATKVFSLLVSIPVFGLVKSIYRRPASRANLPYGAYMHWLSGYSFRKIYAIVFDHALAPVSHYLTRAEVEELVSLPGWSLPRLEHSRGMSWGASMVRNA